MPTVEETYEVIRARAARGHTFDNLLPSYCQQALQWIERNRTQRYMLDFIQFTAVPGSFIVNLTVSPGNSDLLGPLKSVSSLGWYGVAGGWLPIMKGSEQDAYAASEGLPRTYKLDGETVTFYSKPTQAYSGFARTWRFSKWPSDRESTHPLLEFADDVLINHVLMQLSPLMRNPNLLQMYKVLRDDGLVTLNNAQDEDEWPGPAEMQYFGENTYTFEPVIV